MAYCLITVARRISPYLKREGKSAVALKWTEDFFKNQTNSVTDLTIFSELLN